MTLKVEYDLFKIDRTQNTLVLRKNVKGGIPLKDDREISMLE